MDTAALSADGLRQRAAVTRRTLAVLCNLITEYSAAAGCKPATAACELAGMFRTIHDYLARTASRCLLSPDACWAGSSHDLTSPCGGYQIAPSSLADYFERRGRGERRPAEHIDCSTETSWRTAHPVSDDVIAFAPVPLASLIEASGQRVPAFLLRDPAPAEAPAPAPATGTGRKRAARQAAPAPAAKPASPRATLDARELTTARRLLRAAVLITATAAQDKRPEVRRKAAELDLDAAPYTLARQLIELADLLGVDDFPRKPETIIKFLAEPGAD